MREPRRPHGGSEQTLSELGRLNTSKVMRPGWHCRWCGLELIEEEGAILCVDCDSPHYTTTE